MIFQDNPLQQWRVALSCLLAFAAPSACAEVQPAERIKEEGPYAKDTPQYRFADTLEEQEAQLKDIPLLKRFEESRKKLLSNRYHPQYHFVGPEGRVYDALALTFWQGNWHLFYAAYPPDSGPQHWGHAVSEDMVRWRDLPYALYPGVERSVFDGGVVAEEDRVVAFYQALGLGDPYPEYPQYRQPGHMVATSSDPLLLNWEKLPPFTEMGGENGVDADIWKEDDHYIALIGGPLNMEKHYPEANVPLPVPHTRWRNMKSYGIGTWPQFALWSSKDLATWKPLEGPFLEKSPFTDRYTDGSCPHFQKIADKHILIYFSHKTGAQYLLGDYDAKKHNFKPYDGGWFNHGKQGGLGNVHCPAASSQGDNVVSIFNLQEALSDPDWETVMSLPQNLTLGEDSKRLHIEPVKALEDLRGEHVHVGGTEIPTDRDFILSNVHGNSMELNLEIDTKDARWVRLDVLRSPDAEERTSITFYNTRTNTHPWFMDRVDEELVLDASNSSILADAWPRSPIKAPVVREDGKLNLRVFIDRSVVEVFVNGQQYLAARVYPGREDSIGVSLRAQGAAAALTRLDAWRMKPIWPVAAAE